MKKTMFALLAMLTIAVQASAMSYEQARNEALFLTDKMAYELNLTDAQYEAAYEINLDYLMSVTGRGDVFGVCWERRNLDLSYILYSWQWDAFRAATYFFRPLYWHAGYWHFGVYARYPHRDYFYFGRPHFYASYRGGHSWHNHGGHSYYIDRKDHFRPGHGVQEHHRGMRDGYNRGDYRYSGHNSSSTRHTGGRSGHHDRGTADYGNHRTDRGTADYGNHRTDRTDRSTVDNGSQRTDRSTHHDNGNSGQRSGYNRGGDRGQHGGSASPRSSASQRSSASPRSSAGSRSGGATRGGAAHNDGSRSNSGGGRR